jgi:hypothetical protein
MGDIIDDIFGQSRALMALDTDKDGSARSTGLVRLR